MDYYIKYNSYPLLEYKEIYIFICFGGLMQLEACIHPFFDELRNPDTRLPTGRPLPPLFNFKPQGKY